MTRLCEKQGKELYREDWKSLPVLLFAVFLPACFAGSILKNQEDTFAAELHRLKQQPLFSLVDFEQVVDRIRSTVAEVRMSELAFLARKQTSSPEIEYLTSTAS